MSTRPLSIGRSAGQSAEPILLSWSSMRSRLDVAAERDGGRKTENNDDSFENKEKTAVGQTLTELVLERASMAIRNSLYKLAGERF